MEDFKKTQIGTNELFGGMTPEEFYRQQRSVLQTTETLTTTQPYNEQIKREIQEALDKLNLGK